MANFPAIYMGGIQLITLSPFKQVTDMRLIYIYKYIYINLPKVSRYVSEIQLIIFSPVPISGAGTSIPGPNKINTNTLI